MGLAGAQAADPPAKKNTPASQADLTRAAKIRQVLASFYPHSDRITYLVLDPSQVQIESIQARLGAELEPRRWIFFRALTGDRLDGYAWTGRAWGRGHQFSIAMALSTEGVIEKIEVFDYHSSRGTGVLRPEFRQQFIGKSAADGLRPGRGVDGITGATISSNGVIERVRAALEVFDQVVLGGTKGEPS